MASKQESLPPGHAPGVSPLAYRPDVDGLRAVAVLAVLAYHAFPAVLPGGFVGVDIFFVISGFLITGIVLNDLRQGRFTFARFYDRRIRRIFPALGLILCGTLLFGWWLLLPAEFRQLGGHVAAGAGFVSNLRLWSESGYFDTAASGKPLLHLWSLGVEEQYYLVWPLFLLLSYRNLLRLPAWILGIALASFCLNVELVQQHASAAFYFPVTRFWELMLGSLLAYLAAARVSDRSQGVAVPSELPARALPARAAVGRGAEAGAVWVSRASLPNGLAAAGAFLLLTALALDYDGRAFPGWWALLPALGTALLIAAGPTAWLNRKWLAYPAVVFIGLISYPLYLWHWPLLTFARLVLGEMPSVAERLALLVASGVLAWLTYELVEKKIRGSMPQRRGRQLALALAGILAGLGLCGGLVLQTRIPARSAAVPHLAAISAAFDDWSYRGDRVIHGDTRRSVLFFGDSHMQQFLPRIEQVMQYRRARVHSVVFQTHTGCAPIPGIDRRGFDCARFVTAGLERARQSDVETVVIGASWVGLTDRHDYYRTDAQGRMTGRPLDLHATDLPWVLDEFEAAVRSLIEVGKHVVVILPSPRGEAFNPRSMVTRQGAEFHLNVQPAVPRSEVIASFDGIDVRIAEIARRVGAEIVNPMDALCSASVCPTIDADGNPLFMDETHIRSSVVRAHFDQLDRFVYLSAVRLPQGSQQ